MKFAGVLLVWGLALNPFVAWASGAPSTGVSSAEMRAWTSVSGSQVEAAYVRTEGDLVMLVKPDGGRFAIRRSLLSPGDVAYVAEQEKKAVGSTSISGLRTSSLIDRKMILSPQEADALQAQWTDPRNENQYQFTANFSVPDPENKSWKQGKPLTFKITADCTRRTKNSAGRESTTCYMYLLDDQNQPVATKSKSIDSMCPT